MNNTVHIQVEIVNIWVIFSDLLGNQLSRSVEFVHFTS